MDVKVQEVVVSFESNGPLRVDLVTLYVPFNHIFLRQFEISGSLTKSGSGSRRSEIKGL